MVVVLALVTSTGGHFSTLTRRRVFETAVHDGAEQFRLEEKVPESRRVDRDIRALDFLLGVIVAVGGSGALLGLFGLGLVVEKVCSLHEGKGGEAGKDGTGRAQPIPRPMMGRSGVWKAAVCIDGD